MISLPGLSRNASVVIIGGGGALGGSLGLALNDLGVSVGLVGRSRDPLDRVASAAAGDAPIAVATGDVSDKASLSVALERLHDEIGPFTGMVNEASVMGRSLSGDEVGADEIHAMIDTNFLGAWVSVRATAPLMASGGSIVLVSSVAAHRARAGNPIYGATKAGVNRLVKQFAHELGPSGIRVNSISPGQTPTQLTYWDERGSAAPVDAAGPTHGPDKAARLPLRRRGELRDYVGPTLFLLSDLAAYVTGSDLPVDGGLLAVF